ncbi:hypothetical protein BH09MYX1_BH09MYX1_22660 [soil metagenome]
MRRRTALLTTSVIAGIIALGIADHRNALAKPEAAPLVSDRAETPREPSETLARSALQPFTATAVYADGGPITRYFEFGATIDRVSNMVNDDGLINRASARGLDVLDVTWEDTGREMGSSVGPNISDFSLQVRRKSPWGGYVSNVMPVLRFPNFSDVTGDIPADKFFVRVGNEHDSGEELKTVALTDVLKNLKEFTSLPKSIKGAGNMLAARDSHFLVSAQAIFLPIPKREKAEFNPVLYNYQSAPGSPADLAILVTRQGTSIQVIENRAEDATATGWGQELYYNNRGQRSAFTAERRSDVVKRIEDQGGPLTEDDRTAIARGADVMFLIQVPLKHKNAGYLNGMGYGAPVYGSGSGYGYGGGGADLDTLGSVKGDSAKPASKSAAMPAPTAAAQSQGLMTLGQGRAELSAQPDVEQAVVGHGPNLGPFTEGHDLDLVRDAQFPIRITVQFYKATSNGVVGNEDLDMIRRTIADVYKHADAVGSLVIPEGDKARPTAWEKVPGEWFPW